MTIDELQGTLEAHKQRLKERILEKLPQQVLQAQSSREDKENKGTRKERKVGIHERGKGKSQQK